MYEVKVSLTFSAAHSLRGYRGRCEELHGHNWKVELAVARGDLDKKGMVADFKELKEKLNNVLASLDHKHLNDLAYFKKVNPTSENIAKYIHDKLNSRLQTRNCQLIKVTVWETESSSASYYEG